MLVFTQKAQVCQRDGLCEIQGMRYSREHLSHSFLFLLQTHPFSLAYTPEENNEADMQT